MCRSLLILGSCPLVKQSRLLDPKLIQPLLMRLTENNMIARLWTQNDYFWVDFGITLEGFKFKMYLG